MIGVVVRSARPEDHPALQRIFRSASLSNPGDRAGLLAHPEVLKLDDNLIGRGRTRVAALTDGTIIGFASTSAGDRDALELDDLFVDPDFRRHGAALRLVQQIVSEAADEQVVQINVIANAHALEFYLAAGFESDGSTRTPLGVGIRMHLDITSARAFTPTPATTADPATWHCGTVLGSRAPDVARPASHEVTRPVLVRTLYRRPTPRPWGHVGYAMTRGSGLHGRAGRNHNEEESTSVSGTDRLASGALGVAVLAAAPAAFASGQAAASTVAGHAVFVQTNDLAHNTIVAYTRESDGHLTRVGEFATGGRGGVEQDVPLDSLASQDSLTYDAAHRLLFAVNAGSDTVTSFAVDGAHLSRQQTVPSGGVFPVSVSADHDRLFVLNAGGTGNVTGYRINPAGRLTALPGASRASG